MVLDEYREKATPYLNPLAAEMQETSPNTLSWVAFLCAAGAALCYATTGWQPPWALWFLFLGGFLVGLNALFDALDGYIARLRGIASKRGDFLDHVLDRYADALVVVGIMLSAFVTPPAGLWLGFLAIIGVLLASYMGTQAVAIGLKRDYRGILGRADRLVLLMSFTVAQVLFTVVTGSTAVIAPIPALGLDGGLSIMEILLLVFAIGGNVTAVQRGWSSWVALSLRESPVESLDEQVARQRLAEAKMETRTAKQNLRNVRRANRVAEGEARAEARRVRDVSKHLVKAARIGAGEEISPLPRLRAPTPAARRAKLERVIGDLRRLRSELPEGEAASARLQGEIDQLIVQLEGRATALDGPVAGSPDPHPRTAE